VLVDNLGRGWKMVRHLDGAKAGTESKIRSPLTPVASVRPSQPELSPVPAPAALNKPATPDPAADGTADGPADAAADDTCESLRVEIAALQATLRRVKQDEEFWEGISEDPSTVCASLADPAEAAASRPVNLKLDECLVSTVRSAALKLVKQAGVVQAAVCDATKLCEEATA